MRMRKDNFEAALSIAIRAKEDEEKRYGKDFKSAFRAGMENILKASQEGEQITIEQE